MAANIFKLTGQPRHVNSYGEFLSLEKNGVFENIVYFPEAFTDGTNNVLKFSKKVFSNVSFKDTLFHKVIFTSCKFDGCLFLSAVFHECEFINCTFSRTNTNKARFARTYIEPSSFEGNFDLKDDTNIAANLYHSLYKNLSEERQPEKARESLYLMYRAENAHLNSQLKRKIITKTEFVKRKTVHLFDNITSGYGLKLYRIFYTFIAMVSLLSGLNYLFREKIFGDSDPISLLDSAYFTVVTLTTLGYGDIHPVTDFGKFMITVEVIIGIVVISLFLTSISSRLMRA